MQSLIAIIFELETLISLYIKKILLFTLLAV